MSHAEIKQEIKEHNGDPQNRLRRDQTLKDIIDHSKNKLESCRVLIVNPIHVCVGIIWDESIHQAPKCGLRALNHTARDAKRRARELRIPIYPAPKLARSLYKCYRVDQPILKEHFRGVAAAILFSEKVRRGNQNEKTRSNKDVRN